MWADNLYDDVISAVDRDHAIFILLFILLYFSILFSRFLLKRLFYPLLMVAVKTYIEKV